MGVKQIFKDPLLQNEFEQNGFIKITLFSRDEVNKFKQFYFDNYVEDNKNYGFRVSIDEEDDLMRVKHNLFYKEHVFPAFEKVLIRPKFFTGSFMIKDPIPTGTVAAHQDWTFVDEEKYYSIMCWISLDDVTIKNGAMAFLKGSNRFFSQVRGFPCPLVPEPVEEYRYKLMPYLEVVETKIGEVLIFDNKTIHGSYPNMSSNTRHGISITLTHHDASYVAYYLRPDKENVLVKYRADESFFDKYNNPSFHRYYQNNQLLEGLEVLDEIKLVPERITWNELKERLLASGNIYHKGHDIKFGKLMKEQEFYYLKNLRTIRKCSSFFERIKSFFIR